LIFGEFIFPSGTMTDRIHPIHFPTTVAFVDDSTDFLANLCLHLDPQLACRLFDSPVAALRIINHSDVVPPSVQDFISLQRSRQGDHRKFRVIDLNLNSIHREVFNDRRFERISVAVVDYDMPEMDGLAFCREIGNPHVRKILLTGEADMELAIHAFNAGLIDAFIRKQQPDLMVTLNRTIRQMQHRYFNEIERSLYDVLSLESHNLFLDAYAFLRDRQFAARFRSIRDGLGIVEHYLSCAPDGILMLDASGASHLLIVHTAAQWVVQYQAACERDAPLALQTALFNGEVVPYYWESGGDYLPAFKDQHDRLYPASVFNGDDNNFYIYTVVGAPAAFQLDSVLQYENYLRRLDGQVDATD
jgi:CheY-like chemotaxis protein